MTKMTFSKTALTFIAMFVLAFATAANAQDATALEELCKTRMNEWFTAHQRWAALHFSLGMLSVVLSVTAASYDFKRPQFNKLVCLAAAICAAALTFLNPTVHSRHFKEAWKVMEGAYAGHLKGDPNSLDNMRNALIEGQKIVDEAGAW